MRSITSQIVRASIAIACVVAAAKIIASFSSNVAEDDGNSTTNPCGNEPAPEAAQESNIPKYRSLAERLHRLRHNFSRSLGDKSILRFDLVAKPDKTSMQEKQASSGEDELQDAAETSEVARPCATKEEDEFSSFKIWRVPVLVVSEFDASDDEDDAARPCVQSILSATSSHHSTSYRAKKHSNQASHAPSNHDLYSNSPSEGTNLNHVFLFVRVNSEAVASLSYGSTTEDWREQGSPLQNIKVPANSETTKLQTTVDSDQDSRLVREESRFVPSDECLQAVPSSMTTFQQHGEDNGRADRLSDTCAVSAAAPEERGLLNVFLFPRENNEAATREVQGTFPVPGAYMGLQHVLSTKRENSPIEAQDIQNRAPASNGQTNLRHVFLSDRVNSEADSAMESINEATPISASVVASPMGALPYDISTDSSQDLPLTSANETDESALLAPHHASSGLISKELDFPLDATAYAVSCTETDLLHVFLFVRQNSLQPSGQPGAKPHHTNVVKEDTKGGLTPPTSSETSSGRCFGISGLTDPFSPDLGGHTLLQWPASHTPSHTEQMEMDVIDGNSQKHGSNNIAEISEEITVARPEIVAEVDKQAEKEEEARERKKKKNNASRRRKKASKQRKKLAESSQGANSALELTSYI